MFKKILKILIYITVIVFLAFFEVSFLKTLGPPFAYLQIILTISLLTALAFNLERALLWIFLGGFLLDLYSPLPFGIILISTLVAVLIVKGLSMWRFTSHTLYSLIILTIMGILIYHACFFLLNKIAVFLKKSAVSYTGNFMDIVGYVIANTILAIVLFIIVKQIFKRFKTAYV